MYDKKIVRHPIFFAPDIIDIRCGTPDLKLFSSSLPSGSRSDRDHVSTLITNALLDKLKKNQILLNVGTQEFCKKSKIFKSLFNDCCVFAYFTMINPKTPTTTLFQHNEKYSGNFLMSTSKKVTSHEWKTSFHHMNYFMSFLHCRHCIILPITTNLIQNLGLCQRSTDFLSKECLSIGILASSKICTLEKIIIKFSTSTHLSRNDVLVLYEYVPLTMQHFGKGSFLLPNHTSLSQSKQFLQQLAPFIRWVMRIHQHIDNRVNNSIRVPSYDESIKTFWQKLYSHEEDLVIAPINSLHVPLANIILVHIPDDNNKTLTDMYSNAENLSQRRRLIAISWIRSFVNDMQWHESTFFVAVHILDSYIAKVFHPSPYRGRILTTTTSPPFHVSISQVMRISSVNPGFNWWLAAAAALCLAVALEEEHTQTLRARKMIIGSRWSLAAQLNATKGSMLSRLTNGFLITQTPEDFLYYFLANIKNSLDYQHMYCSLQTVPQEIQFFEYILFCKQHNKHFENISFPISELEKQNILPIWKPFSKELNQMYTICLSTLAGLVRFVLLSACVAFMTGFYSMLPTSRLTAVCLVIGLSSSTCPQLCNNYNLLNQFCHDILYFDNVKEFISTVTFCLPLLQQSVHDILNQKRVWDASCSTIFSALENFSYQINSIVNELSKSLLFCPNA